MEGYLIFINYFVIVVIFLSGLLLQNISNVNKKSIFYGVRIPLEYEKNDKLAEIHKRFQRRLTLSFMVFLILLTLCVFSVSEEIAIVLILPETFLGLGVIAVNYLISHEKVKQIGNEEAWQFDSNAVIIDTGFREKDLKDRKTVISPWWFLIPLFVMIITFTGILAKAFSADSNSTAAQTGRWGESGFYAMLTIIATQVLLNVVFFWAYRWTERAKQSLNGGKIGDLKHRSRKIRYYLSLCFIITLTYINLHLMLMGFSMCGIFEFALLTNIGLMVLFSVMPILIVIVIIILLAKRDDAMKDTSKIDMDKQVINRKDDQYYKFGVFYYNKNDPALLVEKRNGIGMTFNLARPVAKVFTGLLAAVILASIIILSNLPSMTHEREVTVNPDSITVSGTWGLKISKDEIQNVSLEENLPAVLVKTNGADIGNKLYGKHKLAGYNNSILFIGDKSKPFDAIYLKDGRLILINYEDIAKTKSLYEKINSTLDLK